MSAHKVNPILYSSQEIDNESFNDVYKIRETALYGYDSVTDTFKPANVVPLFDTINVTYPTGTTEVYTYKTGGVSGTTTSTLTITYTDATKASISSLVRT